ncbi:MAG: hypothetical protein NZM38_07710 [Cytophagales bacterium]|nr:hypothetical protein [Cytophagales bacterium]MDW8384642.1 hypothetical protein [Flammeovirgaceae bacterium]
MKIRFFDSFFKQRTVKEKILIAFFIYSTVSFLIAVLSFFLFREMEKIENQTSKVNDLFIKTLHALKYGQDFFVYDILNHDFYKSGMSPSLASHDKMLYEVRKIADELNQLKDKTKSFAIDQYLFSLNRILKDYDSLYNLVTDKIRQRGIDEFGLHGEMVIHTHQVANRIVNTPLIARLQTIKQYEKEYDLKQDSFYLNLVRAECSKLKEEILKHPGFSQSTKEELISHLSSYQKNFQQIVLIDAQTGYRTQTGISFQLKIAVEVIDAIVSEIDDLAKKRKNQIISRLQVVMAIVVTFSVILTLYLSLAFKFVINH